MACDGQSIMAASVSKRRYASRVAAACFLIWSLAEYGLTDCGLADEAELSRRLAEVRQHAAPALAHVVGADTVKGQHACTGIVVSAEGHLLVSADMAGQALSIDFADGRHVTAKPLGFSAEYGLALAQLEGDGPWPFVSLPEESRERAGQAIAVLSFSVPDWQNVKEPLIELTWIRHLSPGYWFAQSDGQKYTWKLGGVAFDLDGRLIGIECASYHSFGVVFSHASLATQNWTTLVGGQNLDRARLDEASSAEAPLADGEPHEISEESKARANAATVRVRRTADDPGYSGVVISKEGLVASVAHSFTMPGGKVIVSLADGRDVEGKVLGVAFPSDISLIEIAAAGEYPYVEIGSSTNVRPGDRCFVTGFGGLEIAVRQPKSQLSKIVEAAFGASSPDLPTDPTLETTGGDCGGGVFDSRGRLVAISIPHFGLPWPNENPRIELLRAKADELRGPFESASAPEFDSERESFRKNAEAKGLAKSIVELLDGDRVVALGTIADAGGLVVTKASQLGASPVCRLSDGRTLSAEVLRADRPTDLALLRIDAIGLSPVEWSGEAFPAAGALLAAFAPQTLFGCVALSGHDLPADRGHLRARFEETSEGLIVAGTMADETFTIDPGNAPYGPLPLQRGDRLASVEGSAVTTNEDLAKLFDPAGKPLAVAGDSVAVVVVRDGKEQQLKFKLGPPAWPLPDEQSSRCSGFSNVGALLTEEQLKLLGGPVVDEHGKAIGIAVASRQYGWTVVAPAAHVKSLIAR